MREFKEEEWCNLVNIEPCHGPDSGSNPDSSAIKTWRKILYPKEDCKYFIEGGYINLCLKKFVYKKMNTYHRTFSYVCTKVCDDFEPMEEDEKKKNKIL